MNQHTSFRHTRGLIAAATAMTAVIVAAYAAAQTAVVETQDGNGNRSTMTARQIVVTDGDETEKHSIEIRVVGDEVRVIRDGEEVPHAQLTQEDGRIVITDKDGNRVHAMELKVQPGQFGYAFGGAAGGIGDVLFQPAGPTPKVMLGVQMTEPGPALEKHLRLEPGTCTMISGVYEGLAADQAGITEYDIIIKVDGGTPADNATIRKTLAEREPGGTITLTMIHEGKPREATVKLLAYDHAALEHAKFLGSTSDESVWGLMSGAFKEGEMPTWQGSQVFVAPGLPLGERMELLPHIQGMQGIRARAVDGHQADIEARLRALDERLAELDKTIQRLIELRLKDN